jgi:hypothetical protein
MRLLRRLYNHSQEVSRIRAMVVWGGALIPLLTCVACLVFSSEPPKALVAWVAPRASRSYLRLFSPRPLGLARGRSARLLDN